MNPRHPLHVLWDLARIIYEETPESLWPASAVWLDVLAAEPDGEPYKTQHADVEWGGIWWLRRPTRLNFYERSHQSWRRPVIAQWLDADGNKMACRAWLND